MPMPRLFTAIRIPESVRQEIVRIQPRDLSDAVLTPPDELHITLQFIGEVTDETAKSLDAAFRTIRFAPLPLNLTGVGCFAGNDRPGFLWTGVERSPRLLALHRLVGRGLESSNLPLEERIYRPHVTIARLDSPQKEAVEAFLQQNESFRCSFEVSSFSLYCVERLNGLTTYVEQAEYRGE